jgi:hypothetical protein
MRAGADPHQHPGCPGPHQVQGGAVRGAPAEDHRQVEPSDERLQVEGLAAGREVLGGHHRALHHQQVEPGLHGQGGELGHPLRGEAGGGGHPSVPHLLDAPPDQVGLDGLGVYLLHAAGGLPGGKGGDLLETGLGVLVAGPQPFQVEHAQAAEAPDGDRGGRAHHRVHTGGHQRQREGEGVDLPGDVDVVRIASTPAGDDGDVVEAPGAPARLGDADLYIHPASCRRLGGRVPVALRPSAPPGGAPPPGSPRPGCGRRRPPAASRRPLRHRRGRGRPPAWGSGRR